MTSFLTLLTILEKTIVFNRKNMKWKYFILWRTPQHFLILLPDDSILRASIQHQCKAEIAGKLAGSKHAEFNNAELLNSKSPT